MRTFHRVVAAVALLGAFAVPGTAGAHPSAEDHATLVGTGTTTPGLPTTGCEYQHIEIDATLVVVGDHTGTYNVRFVADSLMCETAAAGEGTGAFAGDASGEASYSRTGGTALVRGWIFLNGQRHHIVETTACQIVATSYNPVTSFAIVCPSVILSTHN